MAQKSRANYKIELSDVYFPDNNSGLITPQLSRTSDTNLADSVPFFTDDVSTNSTLPTADNAKLPTVEAVRDYIDASMPSGFTHIFTQNVDADLFKIFDLGDGTADGDAVNKGQMDTADGLLQAQLDKIAQAAQTLTIAASSITFDVSTSPVAYLAINQNVSTFTLSNLSDGYGAILVVKQDATGGRTLAAPTGASINGAFDINSGANAVTVVEFINAAGTIIVSTRNNDTGGGGAAGVDGEYASMGALIADQGNQSQDSIYLVTDASSHSEISTASTYAYFQYLGTTNGNETDYRIISAEEDRALIASKPDNLQEAYNNGQGITLSSGDIEIDASSTTNKLIYRTDTSYSIQFENNSGEPRMVATSLQGQVYYQADKIVGNQFKLDFPQITLGSTVNPTTVTFAETFDYPIKEMSAVHAEFVLNHSIVDREADYNYYFDPSNTSTGDNSDGTLGSYFNPYGRSSDINSAISSDSSAGDKVTIWVSGEKSATSTNTTHGYLGGLPSGRIYKIIGYGEAATLRGSRRITTFSDQGSNVWRASITTDVKNLIVDGARAPMATDGNTYTIDSFNTVSDKFVSAALLDVQTDDYFNNCYMDFKRELYDPIRCTVTDYDANNGASAAEVFINTTLTPGDLSPGSSYTAKLQFYNHKDFLSSENEWAYDPVNDYLYIYSTTNPNSAKTVEAVTADYGVSVNASGTGEAQISVENIAFKNFALDGVFVYGKWHESYIKNCTFDHCTRNGITIRGSSVEEDNFDNDISFNTVTNCGAGGIMFLRPHDSDIHDNTVSCYDTDEHVGFYSSVETNCDNLGDAIFIGSFIGTNDIESRIYRNTITRSFVNGMIISGKKNAVYENKITGWGRIANDVGGIYMAGSWTLDTVVHNNHIYSGSFSNGLTDSTEESSYGIYSDNTANRIIIDKNTVVLNKNGIRLNIGNDYTRVENNILVGNDIQLVIAHQYSVTIDPSEALIVKYNRFACLHSQQKYIHYNADFNTTTNSYDIGEIDYNVYQTFVTGLQFVPRLDALNDSRMEEGVSLQQWRALTLTEFGTAFDTNSIEVFYSTPEYNGLTSPTTVTDDFGASNATISVTTEAAGTYPASGHEKSVTLSGSTTVADGVGVRITFTTTATNPGMPLDVRLFTSGSVLQKATRYSIQTASETHEFYWKNETGSSVTLASVSFRIRGYDGTAESITIAHTDFLVEHGTIGAKIDAQTLEAVGASETHYGPFSNAAGGTEGVVRVDPYSNQITTTLTPKVLMNYKNYESWTYV